MKEEEDFSEIENNYIVHLRLIIMNNIVYLKFFVYM